MNARNFYTRITSLALAFAMTIGLTSCSSAGTPAPSQPSIPVSSPSSNPESRTITNVDGTEITVPYEVNRIGCLFGPSYEKVVMLGAEDKIVFDGDFHINGWPWSNVIYKHVNDVPGIANAHSTPNIEDLVGYEPDVVFNFPNPNTTQAMTEAGMAVVPMAGTASYDSIVKEVAVYAQAIGGDAVAISDRYAQYFNDTVARIASVVDNIPETERPTVYFANQELLMTHGSSSSILDLIKACGGLPVTTELEGSSKTEVTAEQFIAWNPDYIFVDHAGSSGNATAESVVKDMLANDIYTQVSAVANDHVYVVPTGVFFWDSGVQKPLLMLYLASTLFPEQFADVDITSELKNFYSEFFHYDLTDDQAARILAHLDPV